MITNIDDIKDVPDLISRGENPSDASSNSELISYFTTNLDVSDIGSMPGLNEQTEDGDSSSDDSSTLLLLRKEDSDSSSDDSTISNPFTDQHRGYHSNFAMLEQYIESSKRNKSTSLPLKDLINNIG